MTTTPAPSIAASLLTGTSTGPFPTGFEYNAAEDVRVWLELAGVRQADLTLTTHYTLTGATPLVDGGTVTLQAGVVPEDGWDEDAGDRIVISRRTVKRQALALPDTEGHKPRSTEAALDKLMRAAEEHADGLELAVKAPAGETGPHLQPQAARDGRLALFDAGLVRGFDTPNVLVTTDGDGKASSLSIAEAAQTFKGDPGGNAMAVGLFTALGLLSIPVGTDLIQTSGYGAVGEGSARYVEVGAGPATAWRAQTANGRWFELTPDRGAVTVAQFGADGSGDDWAALQAGMTYAALNRVELLWTAPEYSTSQALIVTSGLRMRETCGGVTLTYTGSAHIHRLVSVTAAGEDVGLFGIWMFDSANKANQGLYIVNETGRPNVRLDDISARNNRMVTGSAFNAGASGIIIRGVFNWVQYERLWAETVTRQAGTGTVSVNGCIGVEISRNGSGAPLHIDGLIIGAKTVTTEDTPGGVNCYDCDGVALFQDDEDGATCTVAVVQAINCQGRGLKAQCYRGTDIRMCTVRRSIVGITGGSSEVNVQFGAGTIHHIEVEYSGLADTVHGQGTTCVSGYTSSDLTARGFGMISVANVTVRDLTTGGTAYIDKIFAPQNGSVATVDQVAMLSNVQLFGRGAKALADIGQNGSSAGVRFQLRLDTFMGELRETVVRTNSTPADGKLTVMYRGLWNTGAEVPPLKRNDAASLVGGFGKLIDGGGNVGIARITHGAGEPGLIDNTSTRGHFMLNSRAFVTDAPLFAGLLAAGQEHVSAPFGLQPGKGRLTLGSPEFGPVGKYTVDAGVITAVEAAPGVEIGAGAEPATGDIRIWIDGSGLLHSKNATGTGRYYVALFEG